MADRYHEGEALDRQGLFQLVSDEAFRDGVLEAEEARLMQVLARFLKLDPEEAKEIARVSKAKFAAGELGGGGRLDPARLYHRVLEVVASDGEVDGLEAQMLMGLRQVLKVSDEEHARQLEELLVAVRAGDKGPEASVAGLPGEERDAFRWRVGESRDRVQDAEDAAWGRLAAGARRGVMDVWGKLLAALPPGPVEPLDEALRTLEKGFEHSHCTPGDRAALLRLAQVSRILLRTEWGVGAAIWYGEDRYGRVLRTLSNLLLDLHARRRESAVDEALDLALVGMWRDLVHATRRRQREVLQELCPTLALACRTAVWSAASRLGQRVVPTLLAHLAPGDEGCRPALERLHQELGGLQGPVDPAPVRSPAGPRLDLDLEVVARETAFLVPAAAAARRVERTAIEEVFADYREKVEEQKVPWEGFRSGFFAAAMVPEPPGLDRPLVVLVAAGDGPDAREQLKSERLELTGDRTPSGHFVMHLELGPDRQDRPLFPPIEPAVADAFEVALGRAQGRYLVLLVDRELSPLRLWEHEADFDASGVLGAAIRNLGEHDKEAGSGMRAALERFPWLALAHVHMGLIAKRGGDTAGARKRFEDALDLHPDFPIALTRLGVLAKQAGEPERAIELLSRSLAIDPSQVDAYGTLASIHVGLALEDPAHMGHWIRRTAELHALRGNGPDLKSLTDALLAAGLPQDLFRHLGRVAVDPALYG